MTPTGKSYCRRHVRQDPTMCRSTEYPNILVIDSGGGKQATITKRSCQVLSITGEQPVEIIGYGSTGPPRVCEVANVVLKAHIPGRDHPVLFVMNRVCLLDDPEENESLAIPFNFWSHGVRCCMRPPEYGGSCGIHVENEFFPFQWDKEKVYFNVAKPTEDDLLSLEWFELTSPHPDLANRVRRKRSTTSVSDIPIEEWRKRMAMLPADVVNKTLKSTTHFYLTPEMENRQDPRRELMSHRPGLRWKRRNEVVGTDTFFPSVNSAQGHTCSQMFVGQQSLRWDVFPLKKETYNFQALQDISRNEGVPNVIRSDNAQSETDCEWTEYCRQQCIQQQTTLPNSPWMNFTERHIGSLGSMVRNCHRAFKVPHKYHNWTQRWCCDVHNIAANRKLGWRSPNEVHHGYTPDISTFRFHIWEPIWYFEKRAKAPIDSWKKGRWMGFAHQCGDAFTYWIRTEKEGNGQDVFLKRRIVKTRRKNIGLPTEYVNDNLTSSTFMLLDRNFEQISDQLTPDGLESGELETIPEHSQLEDESIHESVEAQVDESITDQDNVQMGEDLEALYPGEQPILDEILNDDLTDMYNQFQIEDDPDDRFDKIVDHKFTNGSLVMIARYIGESDTEQLLEVPFESLKKDVPLECAKYIQRYVLDTSNKRGLGTYTTWAKKVLTQHSRAVRRLHRAYNTGRTIRTQLSRRAKMNRRASNLAFEAVHGSKQKASPKKTRPTEKQGITIPRNIRHALLMDKNAIGTDTEGKWAAAIAKEMDGLERLRVFDFHPPSKRFERSNGWQFAPMHMIFDIKADGRYKARLCVGGNVLDCENHVTYSSTIKDITIRLLMVVAAQNNLSTMTTDIANAFCTAPSLEQIWSTAGPEFGSREGAKVSLKRALYGTRTASRAFHEFLGALLLRMGFQPSRADQDLWWRKSDEYDGYDYIATHVDDVICVSKDPSKFVAEIEQEFQLRDTTENPTYYLGNDLKRLPKSNYMHVSTTTYTKEVLRKYQSDFGEVRKRNVPMTHSSHPELDTSALLDEAGIKHFQRIIGTCQWLIVSGRFDLCYAITSLSRFSSGPRENQMDMMRIDGQR
eukprot:scaffold2267_cov92-Cylindrotheca_fusiformis.AAC.1